MTYTRTYIQCNGGFRCRYNSGADGDPSSHRIRGRGRPASAVRPLLLVHGVLRVHRVRLGEGLRHRTDGHRRHLDEGEPARFGSGVRCVVGVFVRLCGAAHGDLATR